MERVSYDRPVIALSPGPLRYYQNMLLGISIPHSTPAIPRTIPRPPRWHLLTQATGGKIP
jgi:hypothetical protein